MICRSIKISLLISSLAAISACETVAKDDIRENNVLIKRINSDYARIGVVNLKKTPTGIYLRGEIRKTNFQRGIIPGHLDIEIISPDGTPVYKQEIGYMRRNIHSRYSRFAVPIDVALAEGSVIQIQHHLTFNIMDHNSH